MSAGRAPGPVRSVLLPPGGILLGAALLLTGLPATATAQEPEPQDSVEERQLLRVRMLVRSIIRAQEDVYVDRGAFARRLEDLPGLRLPDSARVELVPAGEGYDLHAEIEENHFACDFGRRLVLTPEDPPELGRIRCTRIAPYEEPEEEEPPEEPPPGAGGPATLPTPG